MRLIDADKLLIGLKFEYRKIPLIEEDHDGFYLYTGINTAVTGAELLVKHQPTVDAVEVVRCKDCVFGSQDPLIDIGTHCGLMGISMLHDSYCSWSMKRDGDKE